MDIYSIGLKVDSRQVKTAQKDLNRFGQTAKTTENTTAKLGRTLAKLSGAVGGLAILRQSINTMMDFNKAISGVQAVTGATTAEIDRMQAKARELGATTQFSATQAANAFEFLGMAGFSASQSVESIGSVLDLAAASGMDLARSADIASNVLSGFQLEAEEAGRMADVLAKGASSANTNVEQLGNAMQFVAPVAATLGISVEESTAAIGALSNAGIQGQKAGTGLRRVLIQLVKPTDQAAQALSKYGLSLSDVDPSVRNFTDILETLRDRNISAADSAVIFGAEGVSAYQALAGQISGIRQLNDELDNSDGAALEMASQRTDNLAGDLLDLKSAFSELQIALLADEVDSALRSATQAATALTRVLGENADAIKTVAEVGATLVAMRLSGWAYGAVGGLAGLQSAARGAAAGLTTAAGAARGLRGALAFLGGPAGLLVGVGSLALSFASNAEEAGESTTDWADEVERLRGNMEALERQRIEQKLFEAEEDAAEVGRLNEALAEAQRLYSIRPSEGRKDRIESLKDERDEAQSAAEAALGYRIRLEELGNQQTENTQALEDQAEAANNTRDLKEETDSLSNTPEIDLVPPQQRNVRLLVEGLEGVEDSASDANNEIENIFSSVNNIIGRFDPISAAGQKFASDMKTVQEALDAGAISTSKAQEITEKLEEEYDKATRGARGLEGALQDIAESMTDDVSNGLTDIIMQAESAKDVFIDLANQIARTITQQQVAKPLAEGITGFATSAIPSLFGGGGGGSNFQGVGNATPRQFANGGNVFGETPAIVGERGPELFVPRQDGQIVPNHQMGGGGDVTVNIINQSGEQLQSEQQNKRRGQNGEMTVDVMVKSSMERLDSQGQLDGIFRRHGTKRQGQF